MIDQPTINHRPRRPAFTLVELLVVISILAILTALLVPRLRTVTKERNIREAARVVGSMFARASQQAVTDGVSGVLLQRNPNFEADGYQFAATRIALLRAVPNFAGDQLGSLATPEGAGVVSIPTPLEQADLEIVQSGDSITFGNSQVAYRIEEVEEVGGRLRLRLLRNASNAYLPDPGLTTFGDRPYSIQRVPRILRSSVTDLPDGHLIDLRYSGCLTTDNGGASINVIDPVAAVDGNDVSESDVAILFDDQGKFDQLILRSNVAESQAYLRTPQSPFFAFVASSELEDTANPLVDETSLWVSVGHNSGAVNVGYNNPSGIGGEVPQNFTLLQMANLFQNDRPQFNRLLTAARSASLTASAAQ